MKFVSRRITEVELNQRVPAKQLLEFVGLRLAPLIAPDDCIAYDLIGGSPAQDGAMHLSLEANARPMSFQAKIRRMKRSLNRSSRGSPPVARVLLGPARPRAIERLVVLRAGSDDLHRSVHDQRARAACTHVNSEICDVPSSRFSLSIAGSWVRSSHLRRSPRQFGAGFLGLLLFFFCD